MSKAENSKKSAVPEQLQPYACYKILKQTILNMGPTVQMPKEKSVKFEQVKTIPIKNPPPSGIIKREVFDPPIHVTAEDDKPMGTGEKAVLIACAQHDGCTREQLTVLTQYKRS